MGDNFKIILEAVIDQSSMTNAQKKIAKEHLIANLDVKLDLDEFAKQKKNLSKSFTDMSAQLKQAFDKINFDLDDKQITAFTRDFMKEIEKAAVAQKKLNDEQKKSNLAEQEKYYQKIISNNKEIFSLKKKQLSADKEEQDVINKRLNSLSASNAATYGQIKKKGLTDTGWQKQVDDAKKEAEYSFKIQEAHKADIANQRESAKVAKDIANAEKERLATIEKSNRERADKSTELFSKQKSAQQEIWNIEKKISTLDPISDRDEISALNQKKNAYISVRDSIESQLDAYNDVISKQERVDELLEIEKKAQADIAVNIAKKNDAQRESKNKENENIKSQIDLGVYDSKYSDLIAKANQWTDASGQTRVEIEKLDAAYKKFADATDEQSKINAAKELDVAIKETANSVRKMNAEYAKDSEISSLHQRVQEFYDKNSATHRKWGAQLKSILDQTGVGAKLSKQELQKLSDEFINIGNSARQAGKLGQSFWDKLKSGVKTFTQWTSATSLVMKGWQITKDMIQNVRDFDDSLLELVKVSDLSAEGLEKVADKAYDLGERVGRTGKQVVDAVTEFKRAGFELNDSMDMAESALVMTNVAEGIDDTADAAGTLISVLKGYNMSESETMSIVDKINQVSNTSPIGFDQIAEGLERTAGTMAQSGTTIDETIGLITAGYAQLRNVEKVSTSLITLSARLRGVDENGDVIDGLSAELQDSFGKIGVAIEDADGNLRSIYAIAKDYAEVLPTLSSKQKQYYAELAAGKRNVTTWNAITQQFQDAEHAVAESLNSVGSAAEENEKYLNSVSGKVTLFESAVEDLSNSTIDSDFIKFIVDLGTVGVKGLDSFIEKFGMLTTLLTTGGLVAGIKNVGQGHRVLADIAYPC